MYQKIEKLRSLLTRSLSACNITGSSKQYMKIDNLPQIMEAGASININQVSTIVSQLKVDLQQCLEIAEEIDTLVPKQGLPLSQTVVNFKRMTILKTLNGNGWHQTKTARELGMSRPTLYEFIKAYAPEEWANRQPTWKEGL